MGRQGWAAAAACGLGLGLIGLALAGLLHHGFPQFWQLTPKSVLARAGLAIAANLVVLAAGALLLVPRARRWGAALAAGFIALAVLVLHLPHAIGEPGVWVDWQDTCESLAVATGAFIVWRERSAGEARLAPYAMGACFVVFGISHFVYARFTASLVPGWLPAHLAFAYATGAIHVLTGVAVLAGLFRRWAAAVEAAMTSSFVLLVQVPLLIAKPDQLGAQVEMAMALAIASAAWVLATSNAAAPRSARAGAAPSVTAARVV